LKRVEEKRRGKGLLVREEEWAGQPFIRTKPKKTKHSQISTQIRL
jgi:stalled ribosome alternative rescue factor ArfA